MLSYFVLTFFEIWAIKFWLKFIRKREKRVQMYSKKLAEKREQNAKKTAEKRKKQLDAQAKVYEKFNNSQYSVL